MTQAREADQPARDGAAAPATAIPPADATELDRLRAAIDRVDDAVLDLLNERARIVREVGEWKGRTGVAIHSAARERDVVARLVQRNAGPFPSGSIEPLYREIISAMRSLEGPLRVGYLGPEGTYSHLAARSQLGHAAALLPMASIGDVFQAVERGRAELGVVPVENTTEGVVTRTLDAFVESDVTICGEILQRISHSLLSRSGKLEDVRRVASIDQPFAQCRRWLERHLPGVARIETASTAVAAKLASEEPDVAAIASALAGEAHGLVAIESGIEDRSDNTTRFLLIGRAAPPRSGRDLTTAVFTVRKAQAGALHQLLSPFAREGVSLTSIQSRPMPGKPFEYLFFLDMEGHRDDAPVARALADAGATAHSARVIGSFPRASGEGPA